MGPGLVSAARGTTGLLCLSPGQHRQHEQGHYQYVFHQENLQVPRCCALKIEIGAEIVLDDVDGSEFASKNREQFWACSYLLP
jgi:hypothetical protein